MSAPATVQASVAALAIASAVEYGPRLRKWYGPLLGPIHGCTFNGSPYPDEIELSWS